CLNGKYTSVNRAAEELSGYTREEILGKTFAEIVAAEQFETILEQFHKQLEHKTETVYEAEIVAKNGTRILVDVSSRLIYDKSIAIMDEAFERVRELSFALRPSLLDDLGLRTALSWYLDRYSQQTGVATDISSNFEDDIRLPRALETACFRIAQEALTNIARH